MTTYIHFTTRTAADRIISERKLRGGVRRGGSDGVYFYRADDIEPMMFPRRLLDGSKPVVAVLFTTNRKERVINSNDIVGDATKEVWIYPGEECFARGDLDIEVVRTVEVDVEHLAEWKKGLREAPVVSNKYERTRQQVLQGD